MLVVVQGPQVDLWNASEALSVRGVTFVARAIIYVNLSCIILLVFQKTAQVVVAGLEVKRAAVAVGCFEVLERIEGDLGLWPKRKHLVRSHTNAEVHRTEPARRRTDHPQTFSLRRQNGFQIFSRLLDIGGQTYKAVLIPCLFKVFYENPESVT